MNLLFVCSRNKKRSLTAEVMFRNASQYAVRSAGTAESARVRLSKSLLDWADIVFVMGKEHKERIRETFGFIEKEIVVLEIPDEYEYMDEELVQMLKDAVPPYLD